MNGPDHSALIDQNGVRKARNSVRLRYVGIDIHNLPKLDIPVFQESCNTPLGSRFVSVDPDDGYGLAGVFLR